MRLYIHMFRTEKLLRTIDRQLFDDIDIFTAAVISLARVAFCIFVCEDAALCFHDSIADDIFRCDHFQLVSLTVQLFLNGFINRFVFF